MVELFLTLVDWYFENFGIKIFFCGLSEKL